MRLSPQLTGPQRRHFHRGLTMPELLTVMAILAILAVVSFQAYSKFKAKAEMADAVTKMKGMYAALASYVNTKHDWPHEPETSSHEDLWEWWMKEMEPWGLSQADWFSSAHLREVNRMRKEAGGPPVEMSGVGKEEDLKIPSFFPANFEDYDDAYQSRYQPWVTESGEFHGDAGILVVMPGGMVQSMPTMGQMNSARGSTKK
ncbi:MAG: prepilin-type N-terminal cleavage/methylation domain-containing protein [Verrucomicrobiota bacterium]